MDPTDDVFSFSIRVNGSVKILAVVSVHDYTNIPNYTNVPNLTSTSENPGNVKSVHFTLQFR